MSEQGQIVKDVEIMHQGLIFKFQIKLMGNEVPPSPPAEQTLDELKIVHTDKEVYDLGGVQQVGELYVRFKKDAKDKNESFEISLSEDGQNWLARLTGEQQDQNAVTLLITPFFNAKYVKFVAQRQLDSIDYVRISGKKLSEPVEHKEEPIKVQPEPELPAPPVKDEVDFISGVPDHKKEAEEEREALEATKKVAEEADDPKDKKAAQETLKKKQEDTALELFPRAGKESRAPIKEGTSLNFYGNFCTQQNPNYDIGGYFSFGNQGAKLSFETCGGVIPIQKRDSDKLHKYVMTVSGDKSVQLQIAHQHPLITHPIEEVKFNTEDNMVGSDKKIGVRQIGIWSNSDYARHIYLFVDLGDNNWHQWVHWADNGQYTAIVRKVVSGTFKNPPPYHFYPYDEEDAVSSIKLAGDIKANSTWCRQINPDTVKFVKLDSDTKEVKPAKVKEEGDKLLWNSDDTLKHNNVKIQSGTYANDDIANTILFASAIDADKQQAFFGIKDMDAIWTGIDSRWYINHHVIDSDVINSRIEFNLLMGAADEIRIQLGNRTMDGWILDNDYAFGGYEFVINREGKVYARIEYFYGMNESRMKSSSYSLADNLGKIEKFDPSKEVHVKAASSKNPIGVVASMRIDGILFDKQWYDKDWKVDEIDIPKGRVDSKELLSLYKGPKMHWGIQRIRVQNRVDNGSLINKIRVYKL